MVRYAIGTGRPSPVSSNADSAASKLAQLPAAIGPGVHFPSISIHLVMVAQERRHCPCRGSMGSVASASATACGPPGPETASALR